MSEKKFHAVVAGATGLVGRNCVEILLDHPAYSGVTVLTRREMALQHSRLEQKLVRYENLAAELSEIRGDHLYCCLGTTIKKAGSRHNFREVDFQYPKILAEHAAKNHFSQFLVVSALGANRQSPFFYNRVKGELEAALREIPLKGIHIFQPSLLTGKREEFRLGEQLMAVLMKGINPLLLGRAKKYRSIPAEMVARAMVGIGVSEISGYHVYDSDLIRFFVKRMEASA